MRRRDFLTSSSLAAAGLSTALAISCNNNVSQEKEVKKDGATTGDFALSEITVAELQKKVQKGEYSYEQITDIYLQRIDELDKKGPAINAVIELNPDAKNIAKTMDEERKSGKNRGPLHGIPVLIKDNIDTADKMKTSAGSLALATSIALKDSFVTQKLREAGAVILGKTNLSEWANIRSNHSTSGWSGRGGLTKNPYALDRNACGSSSGTGAAITANFATVGIGTETDGSIVCPSSHNGLVGIKPTVGLISRSGIIPISHSQDTAGPMCRCVADAAALLGILTGTDPKDTATIESNGKALTDYTKFLDKDGLKGKRIGVARKFFGFSDKVDHLMNEAINTLKQNGAAIIDPADVPNVGKYDDTEFEVLLYELKADLNTYLAELGANAPVKTLQDIIAFNEKNKDKEMPYFGQETFLKAQEKGPLTSKEYIDALAKNHRLSREEGIDAIMNQEKLDAIIAPTGEPAWVTDLINGDHFSGGYSTPSAVAGYPHITVPAGMIFGLPVGISFFGRAWSEPVLIQIAYAFEQATKHRQLPKFLPVADLKA
ncbi:MAG: amidase [Bacteroidetes bacterium]|nr:amidase [Bacteroidota bacterium]MBS1930371.1 amidase [Bacteroidota bacterium]